MRPLLCFLLAASLTAPGLSLPALAHTSDAAALAPRADPEPPANTEEGAARGRGLPAELAHYALQLLGVPYKLGGTDPDSGLDCSGLVQYVFEQVADITLPRTVLALSRVGEWISRAHLRRGDLVFFHTRRSRYSHVGIYVGDGRFVHAPRPGADVEVSELSDPYWRRHFSGARRVIRHARLAAR
ncbi:MAG: C40 family peptidase [Betaproteobacteria bacterium]|nr:C40 family peptidase [Betaproteobacteria bacterium]